MIFQETDNEDPKKEKNAADAKPLPVPFKKNQVVQHPLQQWMLFLGGCCMALLSTMVELPGGLFPDKVAVLIARMLLITVIFYLFAFRFYAQDVASRCLIWWQEGVGVLFSVYYTYPLVRQTLMTYVFPARAGEAPVFAQRAFDLIPLSPQTRYGLLCALVLVAGVLVCFAMQRAAVPVLRLLIKTGKTTLRHLDYPDITQTMTLKKRLMIGGLFSVATAILVFFTLDKGQGWGGDYALYISQMLSLAHGRPEDLIVVWGFSALLLPVYWLVGFDRVDFSSIIYYKIPASVCLALLVMVLFVFFSKRFRAAVSVALTAAFAFSPLFIYHTNEIVTNFPHMLFSMLCVMSMTAMFEAKSRGRQIVYAVLSGLLIGLCDLIRINGIVLVLTLACVQVFVLISWFLRKRTFFQKVTQRLPLIHPLIQLIPYGVYFVFVKLANWLVFSSMANTGKSWGGLTVGARVLSSMVSGGGMPHVPLGDFFKAIAYYWEIVVSFMADMIPFAALREAMLFLLVPLVLIGVIRSFRKELISVVYFFGMLMMLCIIPYRQGARYVFPVLPMLAVFLAVGVQSFVGCMYRCVAEPARLRKAFRVGVALICLSFLIPVSYNALLNMQNHREYDLYSYSEDAKDIYHYLENNTEPDATVVFIKPAVIALNAERKSQLDLPDQMTGEVYYLYTNQGPSETQLIDPDAYGSVEDMERKRSVDLELIYQNTRFDLYQVRPRHG